MRPLPTNKTIYPELRFKLLNINKQLLRYDIIDVYSTGSLVFITQYTVYINLLPNVGNSRWHIFCDCLIISSVKLSFTRFY